jgi:hypothetical protein
MGGNMLRNILSLVNHFLRSGGQHAPESKHTHNKKITLGGSISAGMSYYHSRKSGFNNRILGGQYAPEYPVIQRFRVLVEYNEVKDEEKFKYELLSIHQNI